MARIPVYNRQVGSSTAVGLPRLSAAAAGAGIGQATAELGQQMASVALQRRQVNERSEAAVRLATLMERTGQKVTQRRGSAAAGGDGHSAGVMADFEAEAASIAEGLNDPDVQAWVRVQVAQERSRLAVSEGSWEAGKRADKLVTDYQTADDAERTAIYARPDRAGLLAAIERRTAVAQTLDLPDDAKAKLALDARNGLTLSYMQGLTERDPYAAKAEIEAGLLEGLIDPDRLQALKNRADTEVRGIEAAREQARREAEAEARREQRERAAAARDAARDVADRIRDARDYLANGGTLGRNELAAMTTAALRIGKPELARGIQQLGLKSIVNTELRGASPAEIQAQVNGLSARINAAGPQPPVEMLIAREAAQDKLASVTAALKTDPLSFAVAEGVIAELPAIDPNNPASIAARKAAARRVQARYGGPMRLLTDEEAGVLAERMAGDPASALEAVQTVARFGGRDVATAAAQIAPKNPAAAHLVVLASRPRGIGRQVLGTVFEGRKRLGIDSDGEKTKLSAPKVIDRSAADDRFNDALGGALQLRPQLAGVVKELADQYYAGAAGRRGVTEFDGDLYEQSLAAVLGRYKDVDGTMRGGIGRDLADNTTLLPDDLTQDEFTDRVRRIDDKLLTGFGNKAPVDLRGKPIPADLIRGGQLLAVGNGRYRVAVNGRQVMAKDGTPFEMIIRGAR